MTQKGFSLLEVLLATALSAILATFLIAAFNQINKTVRSLEQKIDTQTKLAIAQHYITRDLAGACIPTTALTDKKAKNNAYIFYATRTEKNTDLLTCVTNNPLSVYWSDTAGSAKPRITRVIYKLIAEKEKSGQKKKLYSLVRTEFTDLDYEKTEKMERKEKKEKEQVLLEGITTFSCTYISITDPQEKEEKSSIDSSKKWQSDPQKKVIPHAVDITLTLTDAQQKHDASLEFTVEIIPTVQSMPKDPPPAPKPAAKAPVKKQKETPTTGTKATPPTILAVSPKQEAP